MAELASKVLVIDHVMLAGQGATSVRQYPSPDPSHPIRIVRTLCRLHLHQMLNHPASIVTFLFRASDLAPMGGAVIDSDPTHHQATDEHELDFAPDGFVLVPQDGLLVVTQFLDGNVDDKTDVGVSILLAWEPVLPPKFVSVITVPGNPTGLLGLKDDGTFWRAVASQSPLVWTPT